jgi:hypothetical protein
LTQGGAWQARRGTCATHLGAASCSIAPKLLLVVSSVVGIAVVRVIRQLAVVAELVRSCVHSLAVTAVVTLAATTAAAAATAAATAAVELGVRPRR